MKWRAQITIGLSRHSQQQIGDGNARKGAIECKSPAAEGSEEGVEEESPNVKTEFHRMLAGDEGHVLNVVIRIVVPALRQVGRTAERCESGKRDLRRPVIKRRSAGVRQTANAERLNDIDVPILLQAIESKSCVTNTRFVDETGREDVCPNNYSVLGSLQFIASIARHITSRTERVRQRIKLRSVRKFICGVNGIALTKTVIDSARPLVNLVAPGRSRNEIWRAEPVGRRIERQQARALFTPPFRWNSVTGK